MSRATTRRARILAAVLLAGVAVMVLITPDARADLTDSQRQIILAEAQAAYDAGVAALRSDTASARESFNAAARRFQQLVDDGVVNGHLYYNLGNAYLQAGDLGRAILSYRRAAALRPGDPDIAHNLAYARSLCRSRIETTGRRALADALLAWHHGTSTPARLWAFTATYGAFWLLLGVVLFRRVPGWRWWAGACTVVWLACGLSVAADVLGGNGEQGGVVLADEVIVRKGNGDGFEPQFEQPLYEGVEFEVREERPGWLHIELADGKAGWIRAADVALVG